MTKLRVLKQGGFSGRKYDVGDVVNVKSTLAPALVNDGRAEYVDEAPAKKSRTGAARTPRRRGAA